MRFAQYCLEYCKKSKKAKFWHIFLVSKSILRRGPKVIFDFFWFLRANKIIELNSKQENTYPDIELVIVATQKDFKILGDSIKAALRSSVNRIKLLSIVVPPQDILICKHLMENLNIEINYLVINENDIINQNLRKVIKESSDNRYGWLIQQFIKINLALTSQSEGVLVLDADTLLLGRNIWLDQDGNQKLVVANYKYQPYFDFLRDLGFLVIKPKFSFVTHHMLFQPNIMKSILKFLGCESFESFVYKVLEAKNNNKVESLSIDFELYGQFALNTFSQKMRLARFCNLSLSFSEVNRNEIFFNVDKYSKEYNSISFHSWH